MASRLPLSNVRIIELANVVAGPTAGISTGVAVWLPVQTARAKVGTILLTTRTGMTTLVTRVRPADRWFGAFQVISYGVDSSATLREEWPLTRDAAR